MNEIVYFHLKVIKTCNDISALEEQGALLEVNGSVLDKIKEAEILLQQAKDELLKIETDEIDY